MKHWLFIFSLFMLPSALFSQCEVAIDTLDDFDSTRLIATFPIKLGYVMATRNLTEDLDGKTYTDEAKAVFTYAESEDRIRSFFLTIVMADYDLLKIENDYNILIRFTDGQIIQLYNVPDKPELNRDILMWMYQHTCVIPLEIFHAMKNKTIEKIRINFDNAKRTLVLEEPQQLELQEAVKCVEEKIIQGKKIVKP